MGGRVVGVTFIHTSTSGPSQYAQDVHATACVYTLSYQLTGTGSWGGSRSEAFAAAAGSSNNGAWFRARPFLSSWPRVVARLQGPVLAEVCSNSDAAGESSTGGG